MSAPPCKALGFIISKVYIKLSVENCRFWDVCCNCISLSQLHSVGSFCQISCPVKKKNHPSSNQRPIAGLGGGGGCLSQSQPHTAAAMPPEWVASSLLDPICAFWPFATFLKGASVALWRVLLRRATHHFYLVTPAPKKPWQNRSFKKKKKARMQRHSHPAGKKTSF